MNTSTEERTSQGGAGAPRGPGTPEAGARPRAPLRVLVVEDEVLIALGLTSVLAEEGVEVLGPASSVADGLRILAETDPTLALLDVHLAGEPVFPLADALAERGVPFIFLSGYRREVIPPRHAERPLIEKPVSIAAVADAVIRLRQGTSEGAV